jgi:hypothetical protein
MNAISKSGELNNMNNNEDSNNTANDIINEYPQLKPNKLETPGKSEESFLEKAKAAVKSNPYASMRYFTKVYIFL